jgi:hypothetical protein
MKTAEAGILPRPKELTSFVLTICVSPIENTVKKKKTHTHTVYYYKRIAKSAAACGHLV